jgi:hypothetical protein
MSERKLPTLSFSLGRKALEYVSDTQVFWEFFPKGWLPSCLSWSMDGTQNTPDAWGSLRIKESWIIYGSSREPAVLKTYTKGVSEYELLI